MSMARNENHQVLVLGNLLATTICISRTFETSMASEDPYRLTIYVLGFSGMCCVVLGRRSVSTNLARRRDKDSDSEGENDHNSSKLPFDIRDQAQYARARIEACIRWRDPSPVCRTLRLSSVSLVTCIVLRALIFRTIVRGVECSWDGVETFLPLFCCLLELFTKDHRRSSTARIKEAFQPSWFYTFRYVLLTAIWSISTYGTIWWLTDHSTYICPEAGHLKSWIRMLQIFGVCLDVIILNVLSRISKAGREFGKPPWGRLGQLALATAVVMSVVACFFLLWHLPRKYIQRDISWPFFPGTKAFYSTSLATLLGTNLVVSTVYLLAELRATSITVLASCIFVYIFHAGSSTSDYSVVPDRKLNVLCVSAFVATFGIVRMEREASKAQHLLSLNMRTSRWLLLMYILLSAVFCGHKYLLYSTTGNFSTHPITALISSARFASLKWEKQASRSMSLPAAVDEYQARYGIPPPPHFDKWWEYAVARDSIIKDDFNQIHEDLLPFWGMKPVEIRNMTSYMIERPWTEVAGLRISNGTTALGPHIPPTHRWMVESAADMINKFAEWLPDMDLAFNINDENRVAVPWQDMEHLKAQAKVSRRKLNQTTTLRTYNKDYKWADRFMDPEPVYPADLPSPHFDDASLRSSFMDYGVIGCPPSSSSQQQTWWIKKKFCHECAKPHSIGPILADWTLSGSLCHQPDLANLHGFHLSPSAFKPTRKPFPVFSQSKIPNFNDIIFPSPWNYRDKVVHNSSLDMPYAEKARTMFWRGATSEGYAIHGTWQGMQRQRFVHMVNNPPVDSSVNILVPDTDNGMGYIQKHMFIRQISSITNISVSFVDKPTRCNGPDCRLQNREFEFGPSVDFQDHWNYKFLFDLDGAGFSGRFLPFLESGSLVFRAAGFRQWFDERLFAWRHFVPVDGRLHGVWHLIAYFGGTDTGVDGNNRNGHDREGEKIAEEGREWAARVLRKEDMEIYMFRLLLEWGRIVDDRREEVGFVLA